MDLGLVAPHNWITDLVTPLAVIVAAVIQKLDARKVRKRLESSSKARDIKLNSIHDLVNGNVSDQKRMNMIQARRIADLTKGQPGNEADVALALEAERIYKDHQERLLRIDMATGGKYRPGETDQFLRTLKGLDSLDKGGPHS